MPNATQIMQNLANNFPGLQTFLLYMAAFMGVVLVATGIYRFAYYAQNSRSGETKTGPLLSMLAGSFLVSLPYSVNVFSMTVFDSTSGVRDALAYQTLPSSNQLSTLLTLLVGVITFYGWYGIVRGCYLIHAMGKPGGRGDISVWNALVHIGAGTVCANFVAATNVIAATAGVPNFFTNYVTQ